MYEPKEYQGLLPAIAVSGPFGAVKEQSSGLYAQEMAESLLKEEYIQHNLAYGTGAESFCGSVSYLGSAPVKTTVNTIRAFEDGDKVILHTIYNFAGAGEQVAFDVFGK